MRALIQRVEQAQVEADKYYGKHVELTQDQDVFDTWFSSGIWPFSTLGWPDETKELKRYYFSRTKGIWMLDSITLHKMHNAESDFLPFYARFVSDSIYQRKHVCSPLSFITIDPDDDFSILETTLDVEQWFAFRPQMPVDRLSNICYGQKNDAGSTTKIIKVNGIGNGYSNVLYFRKTYGKWELYKYEDTSI